ncbi:N-acetyltransferase [Psychromonas aquimarina]|uniref:N-acetyltransferase n=1 Tax=Psychromonas aquimarina TaxID=444919 RepID=UPI0004020BF4|nr:N-acetyltransferase [Psychromonas aquimarina]
MDYIVVDKDNLASEHICCAFSDRKCKDSYQAKKTWLRSQFENGYVFKRLDKRAKVFIEYGPAEKAWMPVDADNYQALGCFWVSGKYKKNGHGKQLLAEAVEEAKAQGKFGIITVAGKKKAHFMSDTKWLLKQGFVICDETPMGFVLLCLQFDSGGRLPVFYDNAKVEQIEQQGCVAYYSNRCPYSEYHVTQSLVESCNNRNIPLKVIKLQSLKQARSCPSAATIFSLFYNGEFITTDISACMDSRFDKFIAL